MVKIRKSYFALPLTVGLSLAGCAPAEQNIAVRNTDGDDDPVTASPATEATPAASNNSDESDLGIDGGGFSAPVGGDPQDNETGDSQDEDADDENEADDPQDDGDEEGNDEDGDEDPDDGKDEDDDGGPFGGDRDDFFGGGTFGSGRGVVDVDPCGGASDCGADRPSPIDRVKDQLERR